MQLSKQQFNKLPNGEKVRLMNLQNQQKTKTRKKSRGGRSIQIERVVLGGNPRPVKNRTVSQGKQVAAAAAYSTGQSSRAPIISMTRDQCRIRHRELIASVTGSTAFTVASSLSINPGLSTSFPWLSVMAQAWEEYEFTSLKYCYYTRTGTNVPGSVMMAIDYDAADAAPASEQIASSYEGVVEDAPWKDILCNARKLSMTGPLRKHYTRNSALAANLDIKTYDVGNFYLMTVDGTAVPWGKLWVEYDITFTLPQLPPTGALALLGGSVVGATAQTAANPFGTAPVFDAQSQGLSMDGSSVLTFTTPGTYMVSYLFQGTVITAVPAATLTGATLLLGAGIVDSGQLNAQKILTISVTVPNATVKQTLTATTVTYAQAYTAIAPLGSFA